KWPRLPQGEVFLNAISNMPTCSRSGPALPGRVSKHAHSCCLRFRVRGGWLLVQPDVFVTPAVVDAVDHYGQPFDPGLPARPGAWIKNDRPSAILGQPRFDFPYQLFAFFLVGLHRLPVDHFVEL